MNGRVSQHLLGAQREERERREQSQGGEGGRFPHVHLPAGVFEAEVVDAPRVDIPRISFRRRGGSYALAFVFRDRNSKKSKHKTDAHTLFVCVSRCRAERGASRALGSAGGTTEPQ